MTEEELAILEAKKVPALMPAPGSEDENGVPSPRSRGAVGWARGVSNRAFAETVVVETNGHGNGHGDGHGDGAAEVAGEEHAAIGSGGEHGSGDGADDS